MFLRDIQAKSGMVGNYGNGMLILRVYVRYRDLVVSLAPSHGLVIAWKLMVYNNCDFSFHNHSKEMGYIEIHNPLTQIT